MVAAIDDMSPEALQQVIVENTGVSPYSAWQWPSSCRAVGDQSSPGAPAQQGLLQAIPLLMRRSLGEFVSGDKLMGTGSICTGSSQHPPREHACLVMVGGMLQYLRPSTHAESEIAAHLDCIPEISLALLQMLHNTIEIPHLQQQ